MELLGRFNGSRVRVFALSWIVDLRWASSREFLELLALPAVGRDEFRLCATKLLVVQIQRVHSP